MTDEPNEFVGLGSSVANAKKEKVDMATIRPKSPRPVAIKGDKDESIWDKIGTLGRKKRIREGKANTVHLKYLIFIYELQISIFGNDRGL